MQKLLELPPNLTHDAFLHLHPVSRQKIMKATEVGEPRTLTDEDRAFIDQETINAYSRARYGEDAWVIAAGQLATVGYSNDQISWILNSKYARWAADHFYAEADGDDDEYREILTGLELIDYRNKWGIDLEISEPYVPTEKDYIYDREYWTNHDKT